MLDKTTAKQFIAPSTLSSQRKILCHFDRREKSFLDPSRPLGMTASGPSPWRPLRSLRETLSYPIFPSSRNFKYLLPDLDQGLRFFTESEAVAADSGPNAPCCRRVSIRSGGYSNTSRKTLSVC